MLDKVLYHSILLSFHLLPYMETCDFPNYGALVNVQILISLLCSVECRTTYLLLCPFGWTCLCVIKKLQKYWLSCSIVYETWCIVIVEYYCKMFTLVSAVFNHSMFFFRPVRHTGNRFSAFASGWLTFILKSPVGSCMLNCLYLQHAPSFKPPCVPQTLLPGHSAQEDGCGGADARQGRIPDSCAVCFLVHSQLRGQRRQQNNPQWIPVPGHGFSFSHYFNRRLPATVVAGMGCPQNRPAEQVLPVVHSTFSIWKILCVRVRSLQYLESSRFLCAHWWVQLLRVVICVIILGQLGHVSPANLMMCLHYQLMLAPSANAREIADILPPCRSVFLKLPV